MTGARDEKDVDAPLYRNFSPGGAARNPAARRRIEFLLFLVPLVSLLMLLAFDEPLSLPIEFAPASSPASDVPTPRAAARRPPSFVPPEWLEPRDVVPHQHHVAIMGAAAGGLMGLRGGLAGFTAGAAAGALAGAWHDLEEKRRREERRLADGPRSAGGKRS